MKVLFIHPPVREDDTPNNVPIGLGWVTAVLKKEGHDVEILDINAWRYKKEQVVDILKAKGKDADIFGISGMITVYNYSKWLKGALKQLYPEKPIVEGGAGPTSIPHLYAKSGADAVVIGEGENTMLDLIDVFQNKDDLGNVDGIAWKADNSVIINKPRELIKNLDELPMPSWDLFPMEEVYLKNNILKRYSFNRNTNVLASRGCPFRCKFCHDGFGGAARWFSADYIIEELKHLINGYKVEYVRFDDETFVGNRKRTMDFCQRLIDENLGLKWGSTARVNLMDDELLGMMKKAGCLDLNYGIESGSQKMLDAMQKDATVRQAENAIALTRKYSITPIISLMVGTPGENAETIQETVDFCKRTNTRVEHIFISTPTPRTAFYKMLMEQGRIKDEEKFVETMSERGDFWANVLINMTDISDAELIRLRNKAEKQIHRNWMVQNWREMPSYMVERFRTLGPKKFFSLVGYAIKKAI